MFNSDRNFVLVINTLFSVREENQEPIEILER